MFCWSCSEKASAIHLKSSLSVSSWEEAPIVLPPPLPELTDSLPLAPRFFYFLFFCKANQTAKWHNVICLWCKSASMLFIFLPRIKRSQLKNLFHVNRLSLFFLPHYADYRRNRWLPRSRDSLPLLFVFVFCFFSLSLAQVCWTAGGERYVWVVCVGALTLKVELREPPQSRIWLHTFSSENVREGTGERKGPRELQQRKSH